VQSVSHYSVTTAQLKQPSYKLEDFDVLGYLGEGTLASQIYMVRARRSFSSPTFAQSLASSVNVQDDELPSLAMKVMRKDDIANRKWWQQERNILATCDSPFVTKLHYAFQN